MPGAIISPEIETLLNENKRLREKLQKIAGHQTPTPFDALLIKLSIPIVIFSLILGVINISLKIVIG